MTAPLKGAAATRESSPGHRDTLQVAGIAMLIGGIVAIIVNILHPRPPEQTSDLLALVASMPHWALIHYTAALATGFIVAGLALVVRTLQGSMARALGEVGKYILILGAATFAVSIVIDGYGYPRFASRWMAASGDEKSMVLWAATAVHTVDTALFPVWAGLFMGLGLLLVAVALWRSGEYSPVFSAFGILGGSMCFIFAVTIVFGTQLPLPLWPAGPAINGIWIAALGAILINRTMRPR